MPKAARITDAHTCPAHGGGPVKSGCATVNIGFQPAARVGDVAICGGPTDAIAKGSANVFIDHRAAARVGDPTVHGGVIAAGCATVYIGSTAQAEALVGAAASGVPFCEECERAKKLAEEQAKELESVDAVPTPGAVTTPHTPPPVDRAAQLFAPTDDERSLAAAEGNALEQRAAREKVVRAFYAQHEGDGLGEARADQDLGVGGRPPRPNRSPLGFHIDISQPLAVVRTAAEALSQPALPGGLVGNLFAAPGQATSDASSARRSFVLPSTDALAHTSGPVVERWSEGSPPQEHAGGERRLLVADQPCKLARCTCCGTNPCRR